MIYNITYSATTASVNITSTDAIFTTDISPNSLVTLQDSSVNIMLSQVTYINVTPKTVNLINGTAHGTTTNLGLYNKLKSDCFNPSLANISPEKRPIKVVTSNYTVTNEDNTISVNASSATTITLPPVATSTTQIFIIKRDSAMVNNVIVDGNVSEMIDDSLSKTLLNPSDSITIQSTGTKWIII